MTVFDYLSYLLPKYFFATTGALCVTSLLLLFMFKLIDIEWVAQDEAPPQPIPNVLFDPKPPITIIDNRPEKPEEPQVPPEIPEVQSVDFNPTGLKFTKPVISTNKKPDINMVSGDFPVASFLANPSYPRSALSKSIEGFVDVQFDVSKFGATENIKVVRASPTGIFESSALRAVKRWRFQPIVKNNEPQPFTGMVRRITYQMQK